MWLENLGLGHLKRRIISELNPDSLSDPDRLLGCCFLMPQPLALEDQKWHTIYQELGLLITETLDYRSTITAVHEDNELVQEQVLQSVN